MKIMRDEGIPTICWMTPILPFINDTEENIRGLLDYCKEAKVYGILFSYMHEFEDKAAGKQITLEELF